MYLLVSVLASATNTQEARPKPSLRPTSTGKGRQSCQGTLKDSPTARAWCAAKLHPTPSDSEGSSACRRGPPPLQAGGWGRFCIFTQKYSKKEAFSPRSDPAAATSQNIENQQGLQSLAPRPVPRDQAQMLKKFITGWAKKLSPVETFASKPLSTCSEKAGPNR